MRLILPGTAQDGGVPQAGCRCRNCSTMNLTAASAALIDEGDGSVILIDATPDFRLQSRRWGEGRLKAIYLTHAHWGHYGGLMQLGKEGWNIKGLPVYLTEKFCEFLFRNEPFNSLFEMGNLIPKIISPGEPTEHGITGVEVAHRGEFTDTLAFMFDLPSGRTLYMPDVDRYDDHVAMLIDQVELAVIDGTFYSKEELPDRDLTKIPHPFIEETARRAQAQAGKIVFTHFNHSNPMLDRGDLRRKELEGLGFRFAGDGEDNW